MVSNEEDHRTELRGLLICSEEAQPGEPGRMESGNQGINWKSITVNSPAPLHPYHYQHQKQEVYLAARYLPCKGKKEMNKASGDN